MVERVVQAVTEFPSDILGCLEILERCDGAALPITIHVFHSLKPLQI